MKDSDDIANLLKQFGGRPDEYYEIGRASEAKDSQARWPLLSSIEATQGEHHPPVEPHTPNSGAQPLQGNLRARVAPMASAPAASEARAETRVEPRFAPPAAAAEPAPVLSAPTRSAPQAQFVPPRPRGHIVPPTRPTGSAPAGLSGMRQHLPEPSPPAPEPPMQTVRTAPAFVAPTPVAPQSAPVQGTSMPPAPASALLPRSGSTPSQTETTPLQTIFQRLSQPQPTPDSATARDKSASLLQRLSRL
jgi:hypothetical protein